MDLNLNYCLNFLLKNKDELKTWKATFASYAIEGDPLANKCWISLSKILAGENISNNEIKELVTVMRRKK